MSAGKHQQIRPYLPRVYKWKNIDIPINYPAPMPLHETTRARSSSSSSDDNSPRLIMEEQLILPSLSGDLEEEEFIAVCTAFFPDTYDSGRIQNDINKLALRARLMGSEYYRPYRTYY